MSCPANTSANTNPIRVRSPDAQRKFRTAVGVPAFRGDALCWVRVRVRVSWRAFGPLAAQGGSEGERWW